MSMTKKGFDAKKYIDSGVLSILDINQVYSIADTQLDAEKLLNRWFSIISNIQEKSGCQYVMAVASIEVFFETNNLAKLSAYESRIEGSIDNLPIDAICCCDVKSFSKFKLKEIINFLNCHEYTIHEDGVYLKWQPHMILELVRRSID